MKSKPSAGKAGWEEELWVRLRYLDLPQKYDKGLETFIEELLASELARERERTIKEFLLLGNRYINKRFKTDNFIILGNRLDKFTQAAKRVKGND